MLVMPRGISFNQWARRGKCCKTDRKMEVIPALAGAAGRPSGVPPTKVVSQGREQARWMYNNAIFEVKIGNSG
jgi:hypothetical protein